jgi:NAD(P)-dependent dehydrogenase (short-subunit alcohol dehydrogenase family)
MALLEIAIQNALDEAGLTVKDVDGLVVRGADDIYAHHQVMAERLGISAEEARVEHAREYALRRISTGADVANAVLFLASDLARQTTGQDLAVDGGWVI